MSMSRHAAPPDDSRKNERMESWHAHNPNQFQRGYAAHRLGREQRGRRRGEGEGGDRGEDEEVDELAEDSEHEETRSRMDVVDDGPRDSQRSRHTAPRERNEYPRLDPNALRPSSRSTSTMSPSLSPPSSSSLSPALSAFGGPSSQSSRSSESRSPISSSSSPLDAKPRYSPSTPYSRSVADTRVSTMLRPAFG
ncbi:unnamed protein product [Cyclocybe aegerita]|uniref:Uncharacterized protein n=1 Tax=Cyclocybe aegerita TaxID=1973307 RepID=A0A8S0VTL9_CYCAE|nr:unnamed protein product [Cyclocybe aegerita]